MNWASILMEIRKRTSGLISRAILKGLSGALAEVNLGAGESQKAPVLFPFGLIGAAPKGSEAIVLFLGGNRDNPRIIALASSQGRPLLSEGQSALHDALGKMFRLNNDGTATLTCDLTVEGSIDALQVSAGIGPSKVHLLTHLHTSADPGSPTSTPTPGS